MEGDLPCGQSTMPYPIMLSVAMRACSGVSRFQNLEREVKGDAVSSQHERGAPFGLPKINNFVGGIFIPTFAEKIFHDQPPFTAIILLRECRGRQRAH